MKLKFIPTDTFITQLETCSRVYLKIKNTTFIIENHHLKRPRYMSTNFDEWLSYHLVHRRLDPHSTLLTDLISLFEVYPIIETVKFEEITPIELRRVYSYINTIESIFNEVTLPYGCSPEPPAKRTSISTLA